MIGCGSVVIYQPSTIVPETQTFEGMRDRRVAAFIMMGSLLIAVGCAPEPSAPATTKLEGVWAANAHLFSFSQLKLTLVQEPKGIVSGGWTARGDGGAGGCAVGVPCDASGNIIGVNLVSKVALEILGAGSFEGVLIEPTRLRGTFSAPGGYDTITFIRAAK